MDVTTQPAHQLEHDGRPYYFCSTKCKSRFAAAPEQFVTGDGAAESPEIAAAPGTICTCPMHPEIRQDHSGSCPKCGMTLEPVMPTLEDDENPELADFKRRFWWTLIGLGTSVAFIYSVVATVAPQVFPATFVTDGRVAVYFALVAFITPVLLA